MTDLLNEMERGLTDLLHTGLATWGGGQRFQKLAADCEAQGLHTGAALMNRIGQLLEERNHAAQKDDDPLAAEICRTVRYITLCREKNQEDSILIRWQSEGGNL